MPLSRRTFQSLNVAMTTALAGVVLFACTQAAEPGDDPSTTPGTAQPRASEPGGGGVTSPAPGGRCEELGALTVSSLPARLEGSFRIATQYTAFALPNRPVISRVKVLASGPADELLGKGEVLGAAANGSWATCTHCILVAIGCPSNGDCTGAAFFFPRAGTGSFTALASATGQPFAGRFQDVELEQVEIDPKTSVSKPVPNGACMRIKDLTFSSTITSTAGITFSSDGGTTTSSGGSSSGSSGGDEDTGKSSTSSGGSQLL